jgi:hypothetical protein
MVSQRQCPVIGCRLVWGDTVPAFVVEEEGGLVIAFSYMATLLKKDT